MGHGSEGRRTTPQQLAHMLAKGQVSPDEVALLASDDDAARCAATNQVRGRHLRERLEPLLAAVLIDAEEAAQLVARVDAGEHDPRVRRRINQLVRKAKRQDRGE